MSGCVGVCMCGGMRIWGYEHVLACVHVSGCGNVWKQVSMCAGVGVDVQKYVNRCACV